jgi:hypothetical protein
MPRGQLTKDEIRTYVLQCKHKLSQDTLDYQAKDAANKYLNMVLDKISEYAR